MYNFPRNKIHAFSLIEVVMALGIFAFVAVALIGLFSVGLRTSRESEEELEATNLAQSLFETRRAAPTAVLPGFPLPSLDRSASIPPQSPVYLTANGLIATAVDQARFGLIYRVSPPVAPSRHASAYVCLFWPAAAGIANAQGQCEMVSSFTLP